MDIKSPRKRRSEAEILEGMAKALRRYAAKRYAAGEDALGEWLRGIAKELENPPAKEPVEKS